MEPQSQTSQHVNSNISFYSLPNSAKNRIFLVLISALSGGFAWRVRGDNGFGGMTGMCVPAILLTLLIFMVYGNRKKLDGGIIGFIMFSMTVTANGWGTINSQITGILGHGSEAVEVSVASGVFAVFLVGFGWVPIWASLMGFYMSNQKYKPYSFLYCVIIYPVFRLLSELVFAHLIIPIIAPDAYLAFKTDLGGLSPWVEYITHWKDESYFTSFIGGRNYTAMVSNLSSCIGALSSFFFIRFVVKDKFASKLMIIICFIFGISIVLADLWFFWDLGGYHQTSLVPPAWLDGHGWSFWEYFTGFFAGGLTMFVILRWVKPVSDPSPLEDYNTFHLIIPERFKTIISFICIIIFVNIFAWIDPADDRLTDLYGSTWYIEGTTYILAVPLIIGWFLIKLGKMSNPFVKKESNDDKHLFNVFFVYLILYGVIYFLTDHLFDWNSVINYIMILSLALIVVFFTILLAINKISRINKINKKN